jgi:large subunit ribosomal protein L15
MRIHDVTQQAGARQRRKRVGRGESSGMGRTSGRGNKGAQSRAGWRGRALSEGGQMPIFRRLPKRGFNNFAFRTVYEVVNLGALEQHFDAGAQVNAEALHARGLIRGRGMPVKVLGDGTLTKKLLVEADACSAAARAAIERSGGTITLRPARDSATLAKAKRNSARDRKRVAGTSRLGKKRLARSGAK